jgi:sphinganine C4-monooxygenase
MWSCGLYKLPFVFLAPGTMTAHAEPAIYFPEFANWIVPNETYPIYYTEQASIVPGIPDKVLSLIAPLVSYWALSLVFHAFDIYGENWKWLTPYRIHESAEVRTKNLVSKWHVVKAVLAQQTVQTILGVLLLEDGDPAATDHTAKMQRMSPLVVQSTLLWLGNPNLAQSRLESWGPTIIHFIYWWAIPALQMLFAL